jgi:hypothetical protein
LEMSMLGGRVAPNALASLEFRRLSMTGFTCSR